MNIDEMYDSDKFGANLLVFHTNYKKFINVELARYDLNLVQALSLVLIDRDGNLNQKILADRLFLTKGAITKTVNKLVDEGFVLREKSSKDKRNYVLNTTDEGRKIVPHIMEINRKWEMEMGLNELPLEFEDIFRHLALRSIELNLKIR